MAVGDTYRLDRFNREGAQVWEQITGFISRDHDTLFLYREQGAERAQIDDYARMELREGKMYAVLTTKKEAP